MSGNYANRLQAAILYDGRSNICPGLHLNTFRMAMLNNDIPLKIVQESRDFVLMMGPKDLQITVTYHDNPADHAVFQQVLGSPVTELLFPGAAECVSRHQSHVLVEVQHGVLGGVTDNPEIKSFFETIGMPRPGNSLEDFNSRVDILAQICASLQKEVAASAIHWTQSNTLVSPDKMDMLLDQSNPRFVTVHPYLYGAERIPGFDETPAGIHTIGAADYIGRELHVTPAPLPWFELYDNALALVRLALMRDGYVVPDGDTFGPETGEFSFLVSHLDGVERKSASGKPVYELSLLYHKKYNYTSPDFKGRTLIKGGIGEAMSMMDMQEPEALAQVASWERRNEMAKAAGGGFEIYRKNGGDQNNEPPSGRFDRAFGAAKRVFGRRTLN